MAVAQQAITINDDNFQRTWQRIMLQAVVTQNHIAGTLRAQHFDAPQTLCVDTHWTPCLPVNKHRFITHILWSRQRCDAGWLLAAPNATAHDPWPQTLGQQQSGKCDYERRLAGATQGNVANHDDRGQRRIARSALFQMDTAPACQSNVNP